MTSNLEIIEFDPLKASDELLDTYIDFMEEWSLEEDPDEPPFPREVRRQYLLDPHPHYKSYRWIIYPSKEETERLIGYGNLGIDLKEYPNYEENKHIGWFNIYVSKEYRRKGLGTLILRIILDKSKELERISTLQSGTSFDEGFKFCNNYQGSIAIESTENRLYLSEVDWKLMKEWRKAGLELSKKENISIRDFYDCPEDIIEEYMKVYTETWNQMPYGEMEGRPKFTPETRRLDEKRDKEKGVEWYTKISVETDGTISGLTEYFYFPQRSHRIGQGLTGVKEAYRDRGLGKWLKAEMLVHIRDKFPDLKFVSTGNATENAPMLSINKRMGFKEIRHYKLYKFKLEELNKLVK
ncbi:MAG: GNAT family N-acetyltransferase [Candidatus Heimdallarchaeaceae archaeon]|jgi:RimJ/RimL family protein N-acetyltransferase